MRAAWTLILLVPLTGCLSGPAGTPDAAGPDEGEPVVPPSAPSLEDQVLWQEEVVVTAGTPVERTVEVPEGAVRLEMWREGMDGAEAGVRVRLPCGDLEHAAITVSLGPDRVRLAQCEGPPSGSQGVALEVDGVSRGTYTLLAAFR